MHMGPWLSWESAAFASQRSRVRIPSGPPYKPHLSARQMWFFHAAYCALPNMKRYAPLQRTSYTKIAAKQQTAFAVHLFQHYKRLGLYNRAFFYSVGQHHKSALNMGVVFGAGCKQLFIDAAAACCHNARAAILAYLSNGHAEEIVKVFKVVFL